MNSFNILAIFNYFIYLPLNSSKDHYDESNFLVRFYSLPTFALVQERHIFYTISRNNRKKWKTINNNDNSEESELRDLIDKISEKQLIHDDEIHKINEKLNIILESILSKK